MKNRLCELFGIKYPIIQAPMAYITWADLAAAVSNAGGLGTMGPNPGPGFQEEMPDVEQAGELLRQEIRRLRDMTRKPFAVNFTIGRGKQIPYSDRFVEVGCEEKVPVAVVSMGSSSVYTEKLKAAGCKVLHAVGGVSHAIKAQADGVDAIVCEGFEGGGHLGGEELTTLVMVPQIADVVDIPLVAGGGIADARGMVAALALGAEGIYMGTRFMVATECSIHINVKQAVVDATDTSTVAFGRNVMLSRSLKNKYTQEHMALEAKGASFEEMRNYERSGTPSLKGRRRSAAANVDGNLEYGSVGMGAIAGFIKEISGAADIVNGLVQGSPGVIQRLQEVIPTP
ncbi:MAG: nitronate monooxygenase [Dehalococcoidia bacterium]|nr:nitronate monooxygenase [Dehalococcoidia bacterium]